MPVPDLLRAAPAPEIIDPPQYSVAWLILAALCLIVMAALTVGTLRLSRAVVSRAAYRRRPTEPEGLKAEFLRAVNDIAARHDAGQIDARTGHHELTAVMRRFAQRTSGRDITSRDVGALLADPATHDIGVLIGRLYEPGFALHSDRELAASVHEARGVIRRWA